MKVERIKKMEKKQHNPISQKMSHYITENYNGEIKLVKNYLWGIFAKRILAIGDTRDDFMGLCDELIVIHIDAYKDTFGCSITTFLIIVLKRKIITYINKHYTDKHRSLLDAISLSEPIGYENDLTIEDMLIDEGEDIFKDIENKLLVNAVLKGLRNDIERKIIKLKMNGYSDDAVVEKMRIPKRYLAEFKADIPTRVAIMKLICGGN